MPTPLLGEIDLHLFGEGNHRRLWDALGANVESRNGVQGVRFAVWAPNARYVNVVGEWNGWDPSATHLEPQGTSGIFAGFAPGALAGQHYKLVIETPDCVVHWKADLQAANGKDPGCFEVDLDAWKPAVDALAARVLRVKGAGDKKDALAMKAAFVDAKDSFADLRGVIAERWLRAPRASMVYAIRR